MVIKGSEKIISNCIDPGLQANIKQTYWDKRQISNFSQNAEVKHRKIHQKEYHVINNFLIIP